MNQDKFKRKVLLKIIFKYIFTAVAMIGGLFLIFKIPCFAYFEVVISCKA